MQTTARIQCNGERECSHMDLVNTSSLIVHEQGKCSALLTREGFFDFHVFKTQCNVSHNVALVCQHNHTVNLVLSNNMSDVKLSLVNGFQRIQMFSSCDPGWFMVDDMCTNFYHCPNCMNNTNAHEQCSVHGGQLAYHLLNNITISTKRSKLDTNTKLSLFWGMFHHVEDISSSIGNIFKRKLDVSQKYQKYFAVNGSALCVALNKRNGCNESDTVLSVGYHIGLAHRKFNFPYFQPDLQITYLWSVIHQPIFEIAERKHMSLCEKSVAHAAKLTNCSEFFMNCNEGTCIHDSLVCDGYEHCPHGEDEAECEHICSDHSDNCMSLCHHRDLCFCSVEYFQCLSGGCVPLQKLCDQTVHCIDKSDEPPTCVYLRPEQLGNHSLFLDINNYINTLIQQNIIIQHRCLQSTNNKSLLHAPNVDYKMHSKQQKCSPSSLSPDIRFKCGIFNIHYSNKIFSDFFFFGSSVCL